MPELEAVNCFWLLLPLLAFNLVFASKLPERYSADDAVPTWLAWLEHGLRVPAFFGPLLMPLGFGTRTQQVGLAIFVVGSLVYLASWIPPLRRPDSPWARSLLGGMAPAYTPALFFTGLAVLGDSPLYGGLAAAFLVVHNAVTARKLGA